MPSVRGRRRWEVCVPTQMSVPVAEGRCRGTKPSDIFPRVCLSLPQATEEAGLLLVTLGLWGELETSTPLACDRVRKGFRVALLARVSTPQAQVFSHGPIHLSHGLLFPRSLSSWLPRQFLLLSHICLGGSGPRGQTS